MFENVKKKLYFARLPLEIKRGLDKGLIVPFEDELYERLDNVYFCGATLSIRLKYLRPRKGELGQCEDRSLFISAGLDDANLVCADIKNLEYLHGSNSAWHFWVEKDGFVYEPSSLYKFKKELYYKLYEPKNIEYFKSEQYKQSNNYKEITSTTLEDLTSENYMNFKKMWFYIGIQGVKALVDLSTDENFKREFNDMLEKIQYKPYSIDEVNSLVMNKKVTR